MSYFSNKNMKGLNKKIIDWKFKNPPKSGAKLVSPEGPHSTFWPKFKSPQTA